MNAQQEYHKRLEEIETEIEDAQDAIRYKESVIDALEAERDRLEELIEEEREAAMTAEELEAEQDQQRIEALLQRKLGSDWKHHGIRDWWSL